MPRSSNPSRVVHLDLGQSRDRDRNVVTCFYDYTSLLPPAVPFEAFFLAHYRSIRELARTNRAGVGLVAVERGSHRLAGRAWVARRPDRPNALIVGRHSECDLPLDDPSISLRHLAILLPRAAKWPMQYTLHELRTEQGVHDANEERLSGALVERVGLFRVGPYVLFTFATGAPEEWPQLAREAWDQLGGSTLAVDANRPVLRPVPDEPWDGGSSITALPGPLHTSEALLAAGEARVGALHIDTPRGSSRLAIGSLSLEGGILLGRYPRCESVLCEWGISRVHLLVIAVGAEIVGVDTASTRGVYLDAQLTRPERVVLLSRGETAVIGDGLATVELRK